MLTRLFPALLFLSVAGCASIASGIHQTVEVDTPGAPGAQCQLKNYKGSWTVPATPVSLEIHDSASDMVVVCEREGYDQATGTFSSSLKAWFFGNILVGGVIGVAVDLGDGAAFGYDDKFVLTMKKSVATPSAIPNKEAGQPQS